MRSASTASYFMNPAMLTFQVESRRVDAHGSVARCKGVEIVLDTDLARNREAFNHAELLLAALMAGYCSPNPSVTNA